MALSSSDKEVAAIITHESRRQRDALQMIPSENYASAAVREAVGSVLMNKYSEGQVGKRYYQGNEYIDEIESLAKKRALKAFGLKDDEWGVNVQAHSGSPANIAVYNALLEPGDTIMSMYLPDGGHLSHGWQLPDRKVTIVSKFWDIAFYHVDKKSRVFDYDAIERQAGKVRPKLLIAGGTAYPREIDHQRMGQIARSVGAYYVADIAHEAGLVAAGVNASPFPHAHAVTMTTHKTLRGPRGAMIFARRDHDGQDLAAAVDLSIIPGMQGGPHNHSIAGIAVALKEAHTASFKKYCKQVIANAQLLAQRFAEEGYDVVSGGTDKHLVLVDLRSRDMSGWVSAWALEYAGVVMNRNTVPYDTGSPYYPSGLRFGTPAITTRGMSEGEMHEISDLIFTVLDEVSAERIPEEKAKRIAYIKDVKKRFQANPVITSVAKEVRQLCSKFPTV